MSGWYDKSPVWGNGEPKPAPEDEPKRVLLSFEAFVSQVRSGPPERWVIEGWFPKGGLALVGGHPKTLKSYAVVQAGCAAADGDEFLGCATYGRPAFVYVTEEGTPHMHADRIEAFLRAYPNARDRTHIVHRKRIDLGDMGDLRAEVHDLVATFGSALVAIDPFRDYLPSGKSEKDDETIATAKSHLRDWLADEPELSIALVHHVVKNDRDHTDGRALSGSGAIYAMADATVLWRAPKHKSISEVNDEDDEDEEPVIVVTEMTGTAMVESRSRPATTMRWRFDPASGLLVPGGPVRRQRFTNESVLAVLDGHDLNTAGLYAALKAQNDSDKGSIRSVLSRLTASGVVTTTTGGPKPPYYHRQPETRGETGIWEETPRQGRDKGETGPFRGETEGETG